MAGTRAGGLRAAAKNKLKYGNDFYAKIGQEGGKRKVPKGFAKDPKKAAEAGRLGGTKSRRGPAKPKTTV